MFWKRVTGVSLCLVKTVVAILNTSKTLDEAFISKGWIHIKTVILRNALLSTFSKNIKQLTYAGCQPEISSQLLLIQYESEDLLPICYQISYGVPEKCVEVDFTRMWNFTWSVCGQPQASHVAFVMPHLPHVAQQRNQCHNLE